MTFTDLLVKSCTYYADLPVVVLGDERQTYAEMGDHARRLANGLADLGLAQGDRVAVLGDNRLDTIEQVAGLALGGFVRSPLYTQNVASSHAYMLNLIGASAVIVEEKYADQIESIRDEVPTLDHVIVMDPSPGRAGVDYAALLAGASDAWPDVEIDMDADHIIRFSAGTTGRPKGIVHTGTAFMAMNDQWAMVFPRVVAGDGFQIAGPLSHAAGLGIWMYLGRGGHYIVMAGFEPTAFLASIEREKAAQIQVIPTMIQLLTMVPDADTYDLSSIKCVQYGAAPISETLLRKAIDLFGNVMYQAFGQSECMPASILSPEHHRTSGTEDDRRLLTSVGLPAPNAVVTIRSDDGDILPPGEVGEICVQSPTAMKGIYNDPVATAERITPDGAVRSRDMGYLDPDGFLHIVDRKEDLIITGGFNVWPLEVENALAEHPDVLETCVVGVPDEKWGEAVFAVANLREGSTTTPEDLIAFAKVKVGSVKAPKSVVTIHDALPKSPVGKLLRRATRELYWNVPVS